MSDQLTVVYAARTVQDAYLLRNLLEQAGIGAVVTNEVLSGGSGVEVLGWPTLARVVVAAKDALRARRIALDFDARAAARSGQEPEEADLAGREQPPRKPWPRCPGCGAARVTTCPACKTSAAAFPPADASHLAAEAPQDSDQALVLCPTCDEPFAPQYLKRCEWCGHEFDDGIEPTPEPSSERINVRMLLVMAAVAALCVGLLAYFTILL